jgi:GMP synthase-like glutamine amidotransferase
MRALSIVHEDDAGPGVFAAAAERAGFDLATWTPGRGEAPDLADVDALMSFGGSMHADQEEAYPWLREEKELLMDALDSKLPILGVCLGAQLLSEAAGSAPRPASRPEIGWYEVELTAEGGDDPLIGPLGPSFEAFEWHSYEVPLPDGAVELARSTVCLQAYRIDPFVWGIQFHAEVSREDALGWIDTYGREEAALAVGVDPPTFRQETATRIDAWNELGATLCTRFLAMATLALRRPG